MADLSTVKVIDFGKATLFDYPITYSLDAVERERYASNHSHVELELREIKGAKTTYQSDVYSLGMLMLFIAQNCNTTVEEDSFLIDCGSQCCASRAHRPSLNYLLIDVFPSDFK